MTIPEEDNDLAVHDPSVIRADDGSFYVFGSHLASARSTDLELAYSRHTRDEHRVAVE